MTYPKAPDFLVHQMIQAMQTLVVIFADLCTAVPRVLP
jgi:hypothetical protein